MDRQDAALRARLQGTGVSVTRTGPNGENITLNMPGNITFAVDSADISSSFYPVLDSVGLVLNEFDKTMVEVAGHTDSDGSEAYNQQLSERRASSVVAYLVSRPGARRPLPHRGRRRDPADREQCHGRRQAAEPAGGDHHRPAEEPDQAVRAPRSERMRLLLDLADALGGDAETVGQFLQRRLLDRTSSAP